MCFARASTANIGHSKCNLERGSKTFDHEQEHEHELGEGGPAGRDYRPTRKQARPIAIRFGRAMESL